MSFAVWLTGLSGSGKSAIARELLRLLHEKGVSSALLESDVLRTQLTPFASYDEAEREEFYETLAHLGIYVVSRGRPVIYDATANRRAYRERARREIARFAEVYVNTPLEVCRARDTKGLYREGATKTLPGMQAPYEVPLAPELVVPGDRGTPQQAAGEILRLLERRRWVSS